MFQLHDAFDAAFHGQQEPEKSTPLKMLPVRQPPPLVRSSVHVQRNTSEPRNLLMDTHLYCDTLGVDLGLVKEKNVLDETRVAFTTPFGRFVVIEHTGSVCRGKWQKRSLFGMSVRVV